MACSQNSVLRIISSSLVVATVVGSTVSIVRPAIAQSVPDNASPTVAPELRSLTWEEFTALTTIPAAEIAEITLNYGWTGFADEEEFAVVIEKTVDGYKTDTGVVIDPNLVAALSESLTQLRWSSRDQDCLGITDSYSSYQLNITFENGQQVEVYSSSNCGFSIPWNVTYQSNQYVQYTGEIPIALYSLLAVLPGAPFEFQDYPLPTLADVTVVGELLVAHSSYYPIDNSVLTEELFYQQILSQSQRFAPFAPFYEVDGMTLTCLLYEDNPQCLNLEGNLVLKSRTTGRLFDVPVRVEGNEIATFFPAELYSDLGNYTAALDGYQAELERVQNSDYPVGVETIGKLLVDIGRTYHYLGHYEQALDYYQQAFDQYVDEHYYYNELVRVFNYRGQTYELLGQYDVALSNYQESLAISRNSHHRNKEDISWQLHMSLGAARRRQGQYEEALQHYYQAYQRAPFGRESYQGDPLPEAEALTNYGQVFAALGSHEEATKNYLLSLFRQQIGVDRIGTILSLSNIGHSLADMDEPELAIVFLKQAINQFQALQNNWPAVPESQQQMLTSTLPNTYRTLAHLLIHTDRTVEAQQVLGLQSAQVTNNWSVAIATIPLLESETVISDRTIRLGMEIAEIEEISYPFRSKAQTQRQSELQSAQRIIVEDLQGFINGSEIQTLITQIQNEANRSND